MSDLDKPLVPDKTKPDFDEQKAEFVEYLRARGASIREACKKAKCSTRTYQQWFKRHENKMAAIQAKVAQSADIQWMAYKARQTMMRILDSEDAAFKTKRLAAEWILGRADVDLKDTQAQSADGGSLTQINVERLERLSMDQLEAAEKNPDLILDVNQGE